mgnify:CR=1 FL=1
MNLSQLDDSSAMLNTLAKIMDKFDIEEIKENPGLFGKLFGNLRKQLDKSSPSTTPWAMKWTRSMSS